MQINLGLVFLSPFLVSAHETTLTYSAVCCAHDNGFDVDSSACLAFAPARSMSCEYIFKSASSLDSFLLLFSPTQNNTYLKQSTLEIPEQNSLV